MDLRIQVLKSLDRGNSRDEVLKFFSISSATLYRLIRLTSEKGLPKCNPRAAYKEQKLPEEELRQALVICDGGEIFNFRTLKLFSASSISMSSHDL